MEMTNQQFEQLLSRLDALIQTRAPAQALKNGVRETLSSPEMSKALCISQKLLLRLRHLESGPFTAGEHYRYQGVTTASAIRWFPSETDAAFTAFARVDPSEIEAMDGDNEVLP